MLSYLLCIPKYTCALGFAQLRRAATVMEAVTIVGLGPPAIARAAPGWPPRGAVRGRHGGNHQRQTDFSNRYL
jgi:hypothetical protein